MRRNTLITLYKTRRIDATYQNIWAFRNAEERNAWLTSKDYVLFQDCKYWKYGEPIKVEIPFSDAFDYDYVKIINNSSDASKQKTYYCFITNRAYINDNLSIMLSTAERLTLQFDVNSDSTNPVIASIGNVSTPSVIGA